MEVDLFYLFGPAQDVSFALKTWRRCPVRMVCLAVALDTGEPYGIWGGLTEEDRRRVPREVEGEIAAAFDRASLIISRPEPVAGAAGARRGDADPAMPEPDGGTNNEHAAQ